MDKFAPSTFKWGNGTSWSYGDSLRSRRGLGRFPSGFAFIARCIAIVILLIAVSSFPWWLTLTLVALFFLAFTYPVEAVLTVLIMDIMSGGIYFIAGVILILPLLLWLKRRLRL